MMAVLLYGDFCGQSIEKSVDVLAMFDCRVSCPERVRLVLNHLLTYQTTARGQNGDVIMFTRREEKTRLDSLEMVAYTIS